MEYWQIEHIRTNKPVLLEMTKLNAKMLAILASEEILSVGDTEQLNALQERKGNSEGVKWLYDNLVTRRDAYRAMAFATFESSQSGAFLIFLKGLVKNFLSKNNYMLDEMTLNEILKKHSCRKESRNFFLKGKDRAVLQFTTLSDTHNDLYIGRQILNRLKLLPAVFKQNCPDVFVFTGPSRQQLSDLAFPNSTTASGTILLNNAVNSRYVYLDFDEDWEKIQNICLSPVHLVKFEKRFNEYFLEMSVGSDKNISSFVSRDVMDTRLYVSEEQFCKQIDKHKSAVLICDSPGMGKTWLLEHICRILKRQCPEKHVLYMHLNHFVKHTLKNRDTSLYQQSEAINLIVNYLGSNALAEEIFINLLSAPGCKIELFIDGFDEVRSKYIDWAITFLKGLITNNINVRLFVTSQSDRRQQLEDVLAVKSLDIFPFTEKDQIDLLVRFWKHKIKSTEHIVHHLEHFAKVCLKNWKQLINKGEKLMGTAFQCQLLAEVNLKYAKLYCRCPTPNDTAPASVSITSLFDMYRIYVKKCISKSVKIGGLQSNEHIIKTGSMTELQDKPVWTYESVKAFHEQMALRLLFPELAEYFQNRSHQTHVNKCNEIIYSELLKNVASDGDTPSVRFVHQSFAEYLVAGYFTEVIIGATLLSPKILRKHLKVIVEMVLATKVVKERENDAVNDFEIWKFEKAEQSSFFNANLPSDLKYIPESICQGLLQFLKPKNVPQILFSCIMSGSVSVIKLLKCAFRVEYSTDVLKFRDLLTFQSFKICSASLPNDYQLSCCAYLWAASKFANVAVVQALYDLFSACCHQNLDDVCAIRINASSPLYNAVTRKDYDLVEFFIEKYPAAELHLLNKCVCETRNYKAGELQNVLAICQLLLLKTKGKALMPAFFETRISDLRELKVHVELLKSIIMHAHKTQQLYQNGDFLINFARGLPVDDFSKICRFLIVDLKALDLFRPNNPIWGDPVPHIIEHMDNTTILLIINVPGIRLNGLDSDGNNLVLSAVKGHAELDTVKKLVNMGVNVHAKNIHNQNALHLSAMKGNVDAANYLLSMGLPLEGKDIDGNTPLLLSANSLRMAKYLVLQNASIAEVNNKGNNVAHTAAERGNDNILQYLLDHGRCKEIFTTLNVEGRTPLNIRLGRKQQLMTVHDIKCVLEHSNIDLNIWDTKSQESIYHTAIRSGYDIPVLQVLENFGANPNKANADGDTALHLAVKFGNVKVVEHILSLVKNVEARNGVGETPFLGAFQNSTMLEHLLSKNIDIFTTDYEGNTIAHKVMIYGDISTVRVLVEGKAAKELGRAKNSANKTPLQYLFAKTPLPNKDVLEKICNLFSKILPEQNANDDCIYLHSILNAPAVSTVEILERAGLNPFVKDRNEATALHLASSRGKIEFVKHLISVGLSLEGKDSAGNTPLLSSTTGNAEVTKYLISKNVNILSVDNNGQNFAHKIRREIDTWLDFLSHHPKGFDILRQRDRHGRTPLHEWIYTGVFLNAASIEQILKLSRDNINDTDETGRTILLTAVLKRRRVDLLKTLLSLGADANQADLQGRNALHHAATTEHVPLAQYILPYIKNREARNHSKKTPLLLAKDFAMIKFLIDQSANVLAVDNSGNNIAHSAILLENCFESVVLFLVGTSAHIFTVKNNDSHIPLHYWIAHKNAKDKLTLEIVQKVIQSIDTDWQVVDNSGESILTLAMSARLNPAILNFLKFKEGQFHRGSNTQLSITDIVAVMTEKLKTSSQTGEKKENDYTGPLSSVLGNKTQLENCGNNLIYEAVCLQLELKGMHHLIKNGADPLYVDDKKRNALHVAAAQGDLRIVKYVLSLGVPLDGTDEEGQTPLFYSYRNFDVFKYLITKNANVLQCNKNGNNIAHYAIFGDLSRLVEHILQLKEAPILFSFENAFKRVPVIEWLLLANRERQRYFLQVQNLPDATFQKLLLYSNPLFPRSVAAGLEIKQLQILHERGANAYEVDSFGQNSLHLAVLNGDMSAMTFLLSLGLPLEQRDKNGNTPLLLAKSLKIAEYLLSQGAIPHAVNNEGDNIAHILAKHCQYPETFLEIISYLRCQKDTKYLLAMTNSNELTPLLIWILRWKCSNLTIIANKIKLCEYDINTEGIVPLLFASTTGNLEMAKCLINLGVNINAKDVYGTTALHKAVRNLEMMEFMVTQSENIFVVDCLGENVAHKAALCGTDEVVDHLLCLAVAVTLFTQVNSEGRTPLYYLFTQDRFSNSLYNLLNRPDIFLPTEKSCGDKLFIHAVQKRQTVRLLQTLHKAGADVNAVNKYGQNVLHLAAILGDLDYTTYFLSIGVSMETRDKDMSPPLHLSTSNVKVMECLIDNNADILAVDKYGDNIAHKAKEVDRFVARICKHRLKNEVLQGVNHKGETPLHKWLASNANLKSLTVQRAFLPGTNINAVDSEGRSMFLSAVYNGRNVKILILLLLLGSDLRMLDKYGQSALHLAADNEDYATVKFLVSKDTTHLNTQDEEGCTPIMLAAGNLQIVQYLITQNANYLIADYEGNNIAHIAICADLNSFDEFVLYLLELEHGHRLFCTANLNGRIPLHEWIVSGQGFLPLKTIKILLGVPGVNVNATDEWGENMFLSGVRAGQRNEVLDTIRSMGIKFDTVNIDGDNALHISVGISSLYPPSQIVPYLLTIGCNPSQLNDDEESPLFLAFTIQQSRRRLENIVEIIYTLSSKPSKPSRALNFKM